jgi:putative serine protease PepD
MNEEQSEPTQPMWPWGGGSPEPTRTPDPAAQRVGPQPSDPPTWTPAPRNPLPSNQAKPTERFAVPPQFGPPQFGPPQFGRSQYGPGIGPGGPGAPPRASVRGWVWPAIAALALVVGLGGGVAGGALYAQSNPSVANDRGTSSSAGLDAGQPVTLPPLKPGEATIANVAAELLPSTVQIVAEFDGQAGGATGSGFVLDREGHVITNNHVVEGAAKSGGPIEVVDQDGKRYDADVVGRSPVYDLAVLSVEGATTLKPAALGASAALRVGEQVVAIGSPLGLSSTVTAGIVSALQRPVTTGSGTDDDPSSYINAVQTDAAINPGNSGGPLVNLLGQVVGVNSAIATAGGGGLGGEAGNIGVGFAIPIEQVKITADQILRTGESRFPVIGAQVMTGSERDSGAEISEVLPDSPAEAAGLAEGDLVTKIDDTRITDGISLIVAIRARQPGETVEFTIVRDGRERTLEITLDSDVG